MSLEFNDLHLFSRSLTHSRNALESRIACHEAVPTVTADHSPLVEHHNFVAPLNRAEPVSDHDDRLVAREGVDGMGIT